MCPYTGKLFSDGRFGFTSLSKAPAHARVCHVDDNPFVVFISPDIQVIKLLINY